MKLFIFLITICFFSITVTSIAQPGNLDDNFGNGGIVIDGGGSASCFASALQKDGKIVLGGAGSDGINAGFLLTLYKSNGQIDSTFGLNGRVAVDFTDEGIYEHSSTINTVVILPDNKILAAGAGFVQVIGGEGGEDFNSNLLLARYLPDGTLDSTFGINAKVMTDFGSYNEAAYDMVVQEDGKIVIGGTTGGITNLLLVRYMPDGELDESFGVGGEAITDLGVGIGDVIRSIALQADGKIVAGGSTGSKFVLARYSTNGALDPSFGNAGTVITDFGPNAEEIRDIALQPDGKILAAGIGNNFFFLNSNMALVRYNNNGSLDQNFGLAGKVNITFENAASRANSIVLQPNGKIVLGGDIYTSDNIVDDFASARCNENGSLDSTFGTDGKTTTDIVGYDYGTTLLLQKDGKIILAGTSSTNVNYITLARYIGDPTHPLITKIKRWIRKHILNFEDSNPNAAYYVIEKSTTAAGAYMPVTKINAAAVNSTYSYPLAANIQAAGATDYYRIKTVNKDNSVTYTDAITDNESTTQQINKSTNQQIHIYPNPAKNSITIQAAKAVTVRLQNSNGLVLLTQKINGSGSMDISKLPNGIYYVVNTVTGESYKLVKE